ncbi:MAG: heme-binding protein [Planctomycetes bacterium]|nr:heme-binding protein [Planctomycetota bacterium]
MPSIHRCSPLGLFVGLSAIAGLGLAACGSAKGTSLPVLPVFGDVVPLSAADVALILDRALASIDSPFLHVAVVDRTGEILGVASTASNLIQDEDNIAVSLARTTAYFSNSQAPLSSRTVETLGTFHFPPVFSPPFVPSAVPQSAAGPGGLPAQNDNTVIAPTRTTKGIAGVPQGPLWQINATNRGADIATNLTTPPTLFNPGFEFRPSRNLNGNTLFPAAPGVSFPSPGITLLPGAVPLYKPNSSGVPRLVGGIGAFVRQDATADPDVDAGEFAAISGARGSGAPGDENFFFDAIPLEGAITIVGILLPYVRQATRPAGFGPGPAVPNFVSTTIDGRADPFGFLIGPRAAQSGARGASAALPGVAALTQADVEQIIDQVVASANITRAQVRLPLGSGAKVIATVVDTRGLILAHFRMEDTLCDAVDVVPAKARSVVYYCLPSDLPQSAFANGDTWPGFPTADLRGIALTTRTLGFLSQPFYPPGIDENPPGPLFALAQQNQLPAQVDRWGNAPPDPGYQNGLTFFPGSVPLYKNGELVGALGVSGDGVEQNDLIAFEGGRGFEPPPELRIDNFSFDGVRLPYLKFPQTPR